MKQMFSKIKSFKEQTEEALSIFYNTKEKLVSINKAALSRNADIKQEEEKLEKEKKENQVVISNNIGTITDINSILKIDPVAEELNKK